MRFLMGAGGFVYGPLLFFVRALTDREYFCVLTARPSSYRGAWRQVLPF